MIDDNRIATWARGFTEPEDEPLRAARARSEEADIPAVSVYTGALVGWLTGVIRARNVVEIGSGGGYSGLWLLRGMDPKGSLTTIEIDPERQALAQRGFVEAGSNNRVRSILGAALAVLPKLADASYDIVFLDAVKSEYVEYLDHARRLLRPGGLLLADNVWWSGRVVDGSRVDEDTQGLRDFAESVREDPHFSTTIFPVGDGLLAASWDPERGS